MKYWTKLPRFKKIGLLLYFFPPLIGEALVFFTSNFQIDANRYLHFITFTPYILVVTFPLGCKRWLQKDTKIKVNEEGFHLAHYIILAAIMYGVFGGLAFYLDATIQFVNNTVIDDPIEYLFNYILIVILVVAIIGLYFILPYYLNDTYLARKVKQGIIHDFNEKRYFASFHLITFLTIGIFFFIQNLNPFVSAYSFFLIMIIQGTLATFFSSIVSLVIVKGKKPSGPKKFVIVVCIIITILFLASMTL